MASGRRRALTRILVVEDDAQTASCVAEGLREHDHAVDVAPDGREGLFLAAGSTYDMLILDRMAHRDPRGPRHRPVAARVPALGLLPRLGSIILEQVAR
jgi:DNA-binding NarL/FixJ family response regulator